MAICTSTTNNSSAPRSAMRTGSPASVEQIEFDDAFEAGRQDRDHEGAEEALDRPGAQVMRHLAAVMRLAADQHRAEMPGPVARIDQHPVEPQHIGYRQDQQRNRACAQHFHRKQILPAPIPAGDAIEEGDQRPGRPEARQLGDRNVDHFAQGPLVLPVDPGRWAQMDLVDQQRHQHHRQTGKKQRRQRGIAPGERRMRPRQPQKYRNISPLAANHYPAA